LPQADKPVDSEAESARTFCKRESAAIASSEIAVIQFGKGLADKVIWDVLPEGREITHDVCQLPPAIPPYVDHTKTIWQNFVELQLPNLTGMGDRLTRWLRQHSSTAASRNITFDDERFELCLLVCIAASTKNVQGIKALFQRQNPGGLSDAADFGQ